MRKLEKPKDNPVQVFRKCISRVRNADLKARLTLVEADVVAAAGEYEVAASTVMLHTLVPHVSVGGVVTAGEMSMVYTQRMVGMKAPGRAIYDKLIAAPAHGRCPLCGQRTVSTLDHHLPKDQYPALVVVPGNLVPACADCNKAKTNVVPQTGEEETLHPYFDNVENEQWLYAEVIEESPAALRFFVTPPIQWSDSLAARVRHHFKLFKLAALYASHAGEELTNIRHILSVLFAKAGYEGVKNHLWDSAASREAAHVNSWQTAMYKALADSDWYCAGGFQ